MQFYLDTKVLEWYIDPNGIENKSILKYPYPTEIKKYEILIIGLLNNININWYQSNTYLHSRIDPKIKLK